MYFYVNLKTPLSVHVCDVSISLHLYFFTHAMTHRAFIINTLRLLPKLRFQVVCFVLFGLKEASCVKNNESQLLTRETSAGGNITRSRCITQYIWLQMTQGCFLDRWTQWPSLNTQLPFEHEIFWIKPVLVKGPY